MSRHLFQNPARLTNHGPKFCPRFRQPKEKIHQPNNVAKEIVLEVENLPHPQVGHTGFQCIVTIEGAKMMVPARVENNRLIVCDKTTVSIETFKVLPHRVAGSRLLAASAGRLCQAFFFLFLLIFAEVFQVLRQTSLIMAINKAGKQLYKFDAQVLVRISSGIRNIKKMRLKARW